MKKNLLLIFILNAASIFARAQVTYYEQLFLPPYSFVYPTSAIELPGGNIIVSGFTKYYNTTSNHEFFCKLDVNGQIVWLKVMTDSSIYVNGSQLMKYDTGGIIHSYGNKCSDLDTNGNILSRRNLSYGGFVVHHGNGYKIFSLDGYGIHIYDMDSAYNPAPSFRRLTIDTIPMNHQRDYGLKTTSDGGYIFFGILHRVPSPNTKSFLFMIKFDSTTQVQWCKVYESHLDADSTFYDPDIYQTSSGDYLVAYTHYNSFPSKVYVLKLDSLGNFKWGKKFNNDTGYIHIGENVVTGNYIFSMTQNFGKAYREEFETDTVFNLVNCKTYLIDTLALWQGDPYSLFIKQNNYQCFLTGTNHINYPNTSTYFIKTNSDFTTYCIDSLCSSFADSNYSVTVSTDIVFDVPDTFTITSIDIPIAWASNYSLVPYCQLTGANTLEEKEYVELFPNPATNQFTITSPEFAIKEICIYNVLGEKVYSVTLSGVEARKQETVNCKLQTGIYFVRVSDGERSFVRKLLVE